MWVKINFVFNFSFSINSLILYAVQLQKEFVGLFDIGNKLFVCSSYDSFPFLLITPLLNLLIAYFSITDLLLLAMPITNSGFCFFIISKKVFKTSFSLPKMN